MAESTWGPPASIPLHIPARTKSIVVSTAAFVIPIIVSCIDMTMVMMHLHNATMEAVAAKFAHRKKTRREGFCNNVSSSTIAIPGHEEEEDTLQHPHEKQMLDLLACHLRVMDAKWYVKPRSTCWFEEYLFNIYTPDMFFDILRMRRETFDKLVRDLCPFIQGQQTHWRQPITVEKKVVVTMFKLMHGASIPLVADKAAIGKSTVHGILRQVCTAISNNFGHHISWPAGRRLAMSPPHSTPNKVCPTALALLMAYTSIFRLHPIARSG